METTIIDREQAFRESVVALIVKDGAEGPGGAFVVPASAVTESIVADLLNHGRGHLRVALSTKRAESFGLVQVSRFLRTNVMGRRVGDSQGQAGLPGVEAREGVSTGISAADRATTIRLLGAENPSNHMLVQPGHIFPVATHPGGVLASPGFPEAALSLTQGVWGQDSALFVEVLDEQGEYPSSVRLREIAEDLGYPIFTLEEIIYRALLSSSLVERVAEANLPTAEAGVVRSIIFRSSFHEGEHVALVKGVWNRDEPVLVRVQPEQTFSDVFGGESSAQLHRALSLIGKEGKGVMVYLRRPASGWLSRQVAGAVDEFGTGDRRSMRAYGVGAAILRHMGVGVIRLLTTKPRPMDTLLSYGISVRSQVNLDTGEEV